MADEPFSVDKPATLAAYATLPLGLDCDCDDCRFAEQHLDRLIPTEVAERLAGFGIDWLKPLELTSVVDPDGTWHMAQLMYEVVGTLHTPDRIGLDDIAHFTHTEHAEPVPLQFSAASFVRDVFADNPVLWVTLQASHDSLNSMREER